MYCSMGREVEELATKEMGEDYCKNHCDKKMDAYDHNLQNCKCARFFYEVERRKNEYKESNLI